MSKGKAGKSLCIKYWGLKVEVVNSKKSPFLILLLLIPLSAMAEDAVILENSGSVYVQSTAGTFAAETGFNLNPGDMVTTGEDGSALILLSDGTSLDLFPNSRLVVPDSEAGDDTRDNLLARLWLSIKGKFSDVEYTSAHAGSVGALRSSDEEEQIFNDDLPGIQREELLEITGSISEEGLSAKTASQLTALVYEEYGQYKDAEEIYLFLIDRNPGDLIFYDMLIDLYFKIEFYGHASKLIELKKLP